MPSHPEDLRVKLLARAQEAINKLISNQRLHEHMTLTEIEQLVGDSEQDFRQAILEEVMAVQEDKPSQCPECGGKLRNKGKRRKQVVSVRGETELERNYYQCVACGAGCFPPG